MNFIESLLNLDPDGGSGIFEATVVLALAAIAVFAVGRAVRRARLLRH